ncbi:Cyclic nucleotide-binding protein [Pseudocohnilembus persalinus]|uniref:Cyclic nucleotide-binding protein n=1 Tax=Pseudocohnilembus persalinus TaxID=266149 RepID=A0A0V0R5Z3_PSEPJ|nr:Cyclic nucleotide-binding protein [Pseudocohnilembus persalinus]|eukprot:KRX09921.1 Cyclic nucleotide-binding protein [Pseudocohnilembus persalinus]
MAQKEINYDRIRELTNIPPQKKTDNIIQELYKEIRQIPFFERYHNLGYQKIMRKSLKNFKLLTFKNLTTIFEAKEQDMLKNRYEIQGLDQERLEKFKRLVYSFNQQKEQLEKQYQSYQETREIAQLLHLNDLPIVNTPKSSQATQGFEQYDQEAVTPSQFMKMKKKKEKEPDQKKMKKMQKINSMRPSLEFDSTPIGFEETRQSLSKQSRFAQLYKQIQGEEDTDQKRNSLQSNSEFSQEKKEISQKLVLQYDQDDEIVDNQNEQIRLHYQNIEEILLKYQQVAYIKEGESFGEIALLFDKIRAGTCITLEDSEIMALDKQSFQTTLKQKELQKMHDKMSFIYNHPLFSDIDRVACCMIYSNSSEQKCHKNQFIFNEGDEANQVILIKSGEFLIEKNFEEGNFIKNDKKKSQTKNKYSKPRSFRVCFLSDGQLVGEENYIYKELLRQYSLKCESQEGTINLLALKIDIYLNNQV